MKNKNLKGIKFAGYKTPQNYFESVDDAIFAKLKEDKTIFLPNSNGLKVPTDYFETLDSKIWSSVSHHDAGKIIPLLTWKKVAYISGIAASLTLALNVFFDYGKGFTLNDIDTASIETYLLNQDINAYDIAPYISTNEINSENFVNTQINAVEIEEYLLQNSDVEHLITD